MHSHVEDTRSFLLFMICALRLRNNARPNCISERELKFGFDIAGSESADATVGTAHDQYVSLSLQLKHILDMFKKAIHALFIILS